MFAAPVPSKYRWNNKQQQRKGYMAALEYREREEDADEGTYVFYADDMTAERVGDCVRMTFWERRRENGVIVKRPILEVVRSGHALKCMCALLADGAHKTH